MASCDLRNFGPCRSQLSEIQLFSRNPTDFDNYNEPIKKACIQFYGNKPALTRPHELMIEGQGACGLFSDRNDNDRSEPMEL